MIFLNEKGTCLDVLYPGSSEEWQVLSAFIDKIFASRWISEKSRITLREGRYILNGQKFQFSEHERKYLSIVVYNLIVKGKIVLPGSPNFYSGESLLSNPHLMELFGIGKITYQVSLKIKKVLLLLADCQKGVIRNGHRTFTSYNLRPPEHWRIDDGQELAASMILHSDYSLHQKKVKINPKTKKEKEAIKKGKNKIPESLQDILDSVNERLPPALQYAWIFSRSLRGGNRLYSKLTQIDKSMRNQILKELGLTAESDLSAAAWQTLFLVKTGKPFKHKEFGKDFYRFMGHLVYPGMETEKRPMVKSLLTRGIGDSQKTRSGKISRIASFLKDEGYSVLEANKEADRIYSLWNKQKIYQKYAYKKKCILTQQIETLANLIMYEKARIAEIDILTIHDCVFSRIEDLETVTQWQQDALELAAKVYRKQMNKCEYLKGRDATPEKKRRIAELLVKELPNSLQEGLADLFSEEFSKIV